MFASILILLTSLCSFGKEVVLSNSTAPGFVVLDTLVPPQIETEPGESFPAGFVGWSDGHSHYVAFTSFTAPSELYQTASRAHRGWGYWSLEAGGSFTYLNENQGQELSANLSASYNHEHPENPYDSAISARIDLSATQTLAQNLSVGLVGYYSYQIIDEAGTGIWLSDLKTHLEAIGPQVEYQFVVARSKWIANLTSLWEFDANYRNSGWSMTASMTIPFSDL